MTFTLITGASSGIGHELARVFAQAGHNLILTARSIAKLEALKNEVERDHRITAHMIPADLSMPDAGHELYSRIQEKELNVDILINNAGFGDHGLFQDSQWLKQKEMIQLNILALTELTRLFLPAMLKSGSGKVMNVASTAAFQPGPYMSVYYATKSYVLSFSEGLAEELRGTGITVTALCPGPTRSGFQEAANLKDVPLLKNAPMASSLEVAQYAYKAMMHNRVVAVEGWLNKIMAASVRFTPRPLTRKLVKRLQEKRTTPHESH